MEAVHVGNWVLVYFFNRLLVTVDVNITNQHYIYCFPKLSQTPELLLLT